MATASKDAPVHNSSLRKAFLYTLIASLCVSALIGIVVLLAGEFGDTQGKILLTTICVGGFSLTGLCCAALYERRSKHALGMAGMVISIASFVYALVFVWGGLNIFDDWSWRWMITLLVFAICTAQASLLCLIRSRRTAVNTSLVLTLVFITITAAMFVIPILFDLNPGDFYYRLTGVFATLDALGTIVTPILYKVQVE